MNQELTEVAPAMPDRDSRDWVQAILKSPALVPGLFVTAGLFLLFWQMISRLPGLWMSEDGYYTHGFLVPFISGYIIYRSWPSIKDRAIKPSTWMLLLFLPVAWITWVAYIVASQTFLSFMFIATLIIGVGFVAGWQWLKATLMPILYLVWALPIWTGVINNYTNPLQGLSTTIAYHMLRILGLSPYKQDTTTILLEKFSLDVGVPCSGLKLVLAISAFTMFFMLIGGLKWWGNLLMVLMILPLCMFINSLRIALIGVVGNAYGEAAGHKFHDYSGYITLIICFFILFKYARLLGWKD